MQQKEERYENGLTSRSLLALLYSTIALMPAVIFSNLVMGISLVSLALSVPILGFVVAFLASELGNYFGSPLKKQELMIIWSTSVIAAGETVFFTLIRFLYYRSLSPLTLSFKMPGSDIPLPYSIPDWFAPPPDSSAITQRTFFHSDWIMPILTYSIGYMIVVKALDIAMGYICYQLFVVQENLPFPMQQVASETIITLSERTEKRVNWLTLSALLSFVYGVAAYLLPFVTGGKVFPIPIPWLDLNESVHYTVRGASFGIGTDLLQLAVGLMLPLTVNASIFAGSFALYFVGNYLIVQYGIWEEWSPGMNIFLTLQRSMLRVWAFPIIGLGLGIAVVSLVGRPRIVTGTFRALRGISTVARSKGVLPFYVVLPLYLASSVGLALFSAMLVPSFPVSIFIALGVGWSFISAIISSMALGTSGFMYSIPYFDQTVYTLSGYKGVDVWYTPMIVWGGGAWWAGWFKICDLTKTTLTSFVKAHLIATPIAYVFSLVYMELLWKIAPIPSPFYPAVDIYWPIQVLTGMDHIAGTLWVTRTVVLSQPLLWILGGSLVGAGIAGASLLPLTLPFSPIGLAVGTTIPIPVAFTTLLGGIIAWVIQKRYGKKFWEENRAVICAGLLLGQSVVLTISVAIGMVAKGIWVLPF